MKEVTHHLDLLQNSNTIISYRQTTAKILIYFKKDENHFRIKRAVQETGVKFLLEKTRHFQRGTLPQLSTGLTQENFKSECESLDHCHTIECTDMTTYVVSD